MEHLRAAIIDDEDGVLDLIELILKEEGLKVSRFNKAEDLQAALNTQTFDIIISDLVLPGISGLDLLDILNKDSIDIPFVLITGYASLDSAIDAVNRGAFYYIKKPFNIEEIRFVIQRLKQRRDTLREIASLKNKVLSLQNQLETEVKKTLENIPVITQSNPFQGGYDVNKVFTAIEYLGRLKTDGLISDKEFGEYKGRILKRII
ncbi:MAG TPA: response regulator [Deltaproteobacteria bacterium]|nr:response regulator [Deltaproteobacteria bacterium]